MSRYRFLFLTLLLAAVPIATSAAPQSAEEEAPALETTRSAIYSFSTLPANLRVAVILYQFDDTGANGTGSNPHVLRLPVAAVVSMMFTGTGHDLATGSVDRYFHELTDNWMHVSGTVYGW